MTGLDEAQARLLALAPRVASETVPLLKALNRYAADDIAALRTQPSTDISAMDGYAVRATTDAKRWAVIGESAAGAPFHETIGANQAVRIFTGAALPPGADSVIIQENVQREGQFIALTTSNHPRFGDNIRMMGSDFAQGEMVVARGAQIAPAHVGLLAASGHANVKVGRAIRVALISTGNELAPVGDVNDPSKLPASNALMIAALVANQPASIDDLGIVRDEPAALAEKLRAAHDADIIVTIGGASVGNYDIVKPVLSQLGAKIDFWKVAMRPGKPLIVGTLGTQIIVGLPGNPVSAFVTALLFLRPLIAHMAGSLSPLPQTVRYPLAASLPANGQRTDHIRAIFESGAVKPLTKQDSAGLAALANAHALIVRPPLSPAAAISDQVDVIVL